MQKKFKDFLLEEAKKWNEETRARIARMLTENPDQLRFNTQYELVDWATIYCVRSGEAVISGPSDADELMDAWRELLKTELEALA